MNEIEKAALEYSSVNKQYSPVNPTRQTVMDEQIKAFKAGHSYALSMAENDFDKMICSEWQKTLTEHDLLQVKSIWSLAQLSCAKELAEKDKEIERLRSTMNRVRERLRSKSVSMRAFAIIDKEFSRPMTDEEFRKALNNGGQG